MRRKTLGPGLKDEVTRQARFGMLSFVARFALFLLLGFGLLLAPWTQPAMEWSTAGLVDLCAGLVRLFGGHAAAHANILLDPAAGFSIKVNDTCNGSNVTLMLWAAILAFRAPRLQKLTGLAAGTLAIHTLNAVRIISLFYLSEYDSAWFDFAHLYVWEWAQGVRGLDAAIKT
jgi:exosortase H (IPTLxxWG-CTERM-specific)